MCCGGHRNVGGIDPGYESAEAATCLEHAGGFQLAVGAGHGVDRHAQFGGQLAHGGQPCSRRQPAVPDAADDLRSELIEKRCDRVRIDPDPIPQLGHMFSISQDG